MLRIFSRKHKKKEVSNKIIVKRGDDVRVYTKAGTQLGINLEREGKKRSDICKD